MFGDKLIAHAPYHIFLFWTQPLTLSIIQCMWRGKQIESGIPGQPEAASYAARR